MKLLSKPSLAERTTLGIGGIALLEACVDTPDHLEELPELARKEGGSLVVLGGGSNILAQDNHDGKELPLILVRPQWQQQPHVVGESVRGKTLVTVGADISLPALLSWCAKEGLSGLEGLVGVPGKLGGAIAMNAGAYGQDIAGILKAVDVFCPEQGLKRLEKGNFSCGYRHFSPSLQGKGMDFFIVTQAELALLPLTVEAVRKKMRDNMAQKKLSQPLDARTAGCIFKNPQGYSAGKLLDECGMRGKSVGQVSLSQHHANFLVNEGKASYQEAMELLTQAKEIVASKTGIHLEMEVKLWPLQH